MKDTENISIKSRSINITTILEKKWGQKKFRGQIWGQANFRSHAKIWVEAKIEAKIEARSMGPGQVL